MTDPRALLDAYAAVVVEIETEHLVFEPVRHDMAAPEAIAALRAVLDRCDWMETFIAKYEPCELAGFIREAIAKALEAS